MSDVYARPTWSQLGEDSLLHHFFKKQQSGFYIDIGAFHPEKYSNTCMLYKQGWSGINVDVSEQTVMLLKKSRPSDISIHSAVSDYNGSARAYMFDDGPCTVNTLDKESADRWSKRAGMTYTEQDIQVTTLDSILKEYAAGKSIDFLNIDVEGLEMQVLNGLDFSTWNPKILAVEIHAADVQSAIKAEVVTFLGDMGYKFVAYSLITAFFIRP